MSRKTVFAIFLSFVIGTTGTTIPIVFNLDLSNHTTVYQADSSKKT